MTSTSRSGITASLISPSGTVLLHRASCHTEPAEDARAQAIRICVHAHEAAVYAAGDDAASGAAETVDIA